MYSHKPLQSSPKLPATSTGTLVAWVSLTTLLLVCGLLNQYSGGFSVMDFPEIKTATTLTEF